MKTICESYSFKSLIKQPTCYENHPRPTCIDLTLTSVPRCFQSLCVIFVRFSFVDIDCPQKSLQKVST